MFPIIPITHTMFPKKKPAAGEPLPFGVYFTDHMFIMDYVEGKGIKKGELSILLHIENKDILNDLRINLSEKNAEFVECEAGCVVGAHAGPGACGIFFIENY